MTLTLFDPRTGIEVKVWVPDRPSTAQSVPATVIRHPSSPRM